MKVGDFVITTELHVGKIETMTLDAVRRARVNGVWSPVSQMRLATWDEVAAAAKKRRGGHERT